MRQVVDRTLAVIAAVEEAVPLWRPLRSGSGPTHAATVAVVEHAAMADVAVAFAGVNDPGRIDIALNTVTGSAPTWVGPVPGRRVGL